MRIFSKKTALFLLLPFFLPLLQSCGNKSVGGIKSRTYELRVIPSESSARLKFEGTDRYSIPTGLSMACWKGCDNKGMRGAFSKCTLDKINRHINEHLQIPGIAMGETIEGNTMVKFLVDGQGKVVSLSVIKDPGGGIGEEALRLVESFPEWDSALINGENAVSTEIKMEVRFDIVLR